VIEFIKEDPERAEAVGKTILMGLEQHGLLDAHPAAFNVAKSYLLSPTLQTFLMDVFRAVRGERD
jgi:hypothetical protein